MHPTSDVDEPNPFSSKSVSYPTRASKQKNSTNINTSYNINIYIQSSLHLHELHDVLGYNCCVFPSPFFDSVCVFVATVDGRNPAPPGM